MNSALIFPYDAATLINYFVDTYTGHPNRPHQGAIIKIFKKRCRQTNNNFIEDCCSLSEQDISCDYSSLRSFIENFTKRNKTTATQINAVNYVDYNVKKYKMVDQRNSHLVAHCNNINFIF